MGKLLLAQDFNRNPPKSARQKGMDGLTGGCCRTQLQVCSCCSIGEDDDNFPSILTCEGEEAAYGCCVCCCCELRCCCIIVDVRFWNY
ncbi:hypothetical protein MTR67_000836 [Solanum verrucosum]|uniref:Uncharacterized protein n=1 Tax=Solanum verrucosum TaxID=315347 RepID=A0AAF0PRI8_SOLVR|nr:hypothetical protein MTR67_000836 [Solanum verrucosum]